MKIKILAILVASITPLLVACGGQAPAFVPAEPASTTATTQPGEETRIELDDGAAIVIPANALADDATVTIERNPEKAQSLPPLGEGVVQLGDFYNFEVSGDALIGPVDLILPLEEEEIPEESGILTAAIPTDDGWEFIPVEADGDHITIYTDQLGDPLIAWHFVDVDDRIDLSTDREPAEPATICDPHIAVQVIPGEGEGAFEVRGRVVPVDTRVEKYGLFPELFGGVTELEPASNIPVEIVVNQRDVRRAPTNFIVHTDEDGSFSLTLDAGDPSHGLNESWNWVFVNAQCAEWPGKISVESTGYAEFTYTPPEKIAEDATEAAVEEEPAAEAEEPAEAAIPEGAVQIPDVVGMQFGDASDTLEGLGFGVTWIDGSSELELGMIFKQEPAAGTFYVPHRTTIVLHRTTEQVLTPITAIYHGESIPVSVEDTGFSATNCALGEITPKSAQVEIYPDGSISGTLGSGRSQLELSGTRESIVSSETAHAPSQSFYYAEGVKLTNDDQILEGTLAMETLDCRRTWSFALERR